MQGYVFSREGEDGWEEGKAVKVPITGSSEESTEIGIGETDMFVTPELQRLRQEDL